MDLATIETVLTTVCDILQTVIFGVGGTVAYVQFRESYGVRRLQILSSFNERLGRCAKANEWVWNPQKKWSDLAPDVRHEYQNYVATFEDIGIARSAGIISKTDFIVSYGGRFSKLQESGTLSQFISDAGFQEINFENLRVILTDIGHSL